PGLGELVARTSFCRSALHHRPVDVPVIHLDSDAFPAELTCDFFSHGDGAVTTAPAGNVHTGEDWLYLQGVHCDERADAVHIERDDAVRTRRSEEHTSELQSREKLVCRLLLE